MIIRETSIAAAVRNRSVRHASTPRRQRGFLLNPFRFGGGAQPTDPNFGSVGALLHFEGSDGSTTFVDSSGSPKTFTAAGNAQIDTAQFKYGAASGLFDGAGDYVSTPHNAAFDVATGNFTIECFVRVRGGLGGQMILCSKATNAGVSPYYLFITTGSRFGFNGYNQGGGAFVFTLTGTTTVVTGAWYHVAAVREGNDFRLYVSGVQEATSNSSSNLHSSASDPLVLGGFNNGAQSFNGWIDEFRFTKNVARYTGGASFTPPSAPFPNG
jgi:hypothetical protein